MIKRSINRTMRNRAARATRVEQFLRDREHPRDRDDGTSALDLFTAGAAIASVLVAIASVVVGYWAWDTSADALRNAEQANQLAFQAAQYANWPLLDVDIDRTNMTLTVTNKGTGVAHVFSHEGDPWVGPATSGLSLERSPTNFAKPASWITTPGTTPLMSKANYAGYIRFDRVGTLIAAGERRMVFELDYDGFERFMNEPDKPKVDLRSSMQIEFDTVLNKISFGLCYTDISASNAAYASHNLNRQLDCQTTLDRALSSAHKGKFSAGWQMRPSLMTAKP